MGFEYYISTSFQDLLSAALDESGLADDMDMETPAVLTAGTPTIRTIQTNVYRPQVANTNVGLIEISSFTE